jgi:hypothetical protein
VPFGLLDGQLVEPTNVVNGRACGCTCPACARPLIAYNQGRVRTGAWFGHAPGEDCLSARETALHLMAKTLLAEERMLQFPAVVVLKRREPGTFFLDDEFRREEIRHAQRITFSRVDLEASRTFRVPQAGGAGETSCLLRADALAVDAGDPSVEYWIEIRVHHAVDAEKRRALQGIGVQALEIDLRWMLGEDITKARVRAALLDEVLHRHWLAYYGHLVPEPQFVGKVKPSRPWR